MYIYSHNPHSRGTRALSLSLGAKRIKHNRSRFKGHRDKVVINWGAHTLPEEVGLCTVLNLPQAVGLAASKNSFFEIVSSSGETPNEIIANANLVPAYTTMRGVAENWIEQGYVVVCRTLLNASEGRGIVIARTEEEVVNAPLYTQYIKKRDEYRVHIVRGNVIDVQRKAKKNGVEEVNYQIRSHNNGFVYIRGGVAPPDCVLDVARDVFGLFELDFGAIDIIYNRHQGRAYALEINTAPGLEGQTVESYADAFRRM